MNHLLQGPDPVSCSCKQLYSEATQRLLGITEVVTFEMWYAATMTIYMHIHAYIYIIFYFFTLNYIYKVSPKKIENVFSACYVLKTDGKILTEISGRNFLMKTLQAWEIHRTHAESTGSWGILKIEKPKWKI